MHARFTKDAQTPTPVDGLLNPPSAAPIDTSARRQALHQRLNREAESAHWDAAVATLAQLATIETDPRARARYHYSAAVICRDELRSPAEAVACLLKTLVDAPDDDRAFDAIELLLHATEDWRALRRLYRLRLRELPVESPPELAARLWTALGTLSSAQLDDPETARLSYETAAALHPSASEPLEGLATLHLAAGPSGIDKAIGAHQRILAFSPDRLTSYRVLAELFGRVGAFERQWWAETAIQILGDGVPRSEPISSYASRPPQLIPPQIRFDDDVWEKLTPHAGSRPLDEVLSLVGPAVVRAASLRPGVLGVRRAGAVQDGFAPQALAYVARVLDLQAPELHRRDGHIVPLSAHWVCERERVGPVFLITRAFEALSDDAMIFALAARTAVVRPRWSAALGHPHGASLAAALQPILAGTPLAPSLGALSPAELEDHCAQFLSRIQTAADRAAFLLSGDLWAAFESLTMDATKSDDARARVAALAAFALSDVHLELRTRLGLNNGAEDGGRRWVGG